MQSRYFKDAINCQLIELRSDSRAIADSLTAKIGNDIEKGFKNNLISYNILYSLMHCCLCFSFLCDVSLLFIFYHSPYDFNVTYDSLIKKLKLSKQNFSLIVAIFCPEIITKTSNYRFLEVIKTLFSLIFQTFSTLNSIRGLIVGQRLLQ